MADITKNIEVKSISKGDWEHVGYSDPSNYLYVRIGGELYLVTADDEFIQEGEEVDQKALDSEAANEVIDELISDADDG